MADFLFRRYAPPDQPALDRMAEEIVRDGTAFPFEDVEGVRRYWSSPGAHVIVACEGDEVVGSYVVKPNHPDRGAHVGNAGYMVAESQRGRGLGLALGEHSLETARGFGFRALQFNFVVATNEPAVRLWKKLGFSVLGEIPEGFRHPKLGYVGVLVMHRRL